MNEDLKMIESIIYNDEGKKMSYVDVDNAEGEKFINAVEALIARNKELEAYQHKVNQILKLDDDNLDHCSSDNCQKGLKKCVTEFEKENQSYRDYFGTPPCDDNADYIKSKVEEKIEELNKEFQKKLGHNDIGAFIIKCKIQALKELLQ